LRPGFLRTQNMKKLGCHESLKQEIKKYLERLRYADKESLIILRPNGRTRVFEGDSKHVSVPNQSLFELKDATVLHNHTQGASFSIEDIFALIKYDAKECYLITPKYLYTLKRPKNGWKIDINSVSFEDQINSIRELAEDELNKMVAKNDISLHEKEVEIFHYIWVFVFKANNIQYAREKV